MSRRLLASYLALTVAVLIALEVPLAIVDARSERQDLTAKVERDAFAVASLAEDTLQAGGGPSAALQRVVVHYQAATGGRVVIVDRKGRRVADSHPTTPNETEFATEARPEILTALHGHVAAGTRYSSTLHKRLLYVAVPVASGGALLGAVRITYPTSTLDARVTRYRLALLAVGLIVIAVATATGLVLARSISRPLRRLEQVAARVGAGDLKARAAEDDGPPEVRRLAAELNRSTAKLSSLLASQEQFVADASHELRTPLTALKLRLENGDQEGALGEVDRIARLVNELLVLARVDAGREPARELDLRSAVAGRVEAWEPYATEHGVELVAPESSSVVVRAAQGRVEQVLDNLLSNALEAAPPGSAVSVRLDATGLHVVDDGPGLSPEQRAHAFDRFWRGRSGPGSGLGLAIAKRLVELDGGTIELTASPSGGVDAVVRYPILRGVREPLPAATTRS
jgi:signal transduction histidine kinase